MDWDKLRIFHTVAEAGSFTLAAKRLAVSQSAVSRQIRGLEESLNVSLFNRHARGLVLTNEGEQLFETSREVIDKVEAVERELLESKERPSGLLRVTTTVSFGSYWLTPRVKNFVRNFPEIDLQLVLSDADIDLATREADVAIWFHPPDQADYIQKPLVTVNYHIYGSPQYLNKRGTPATLSDLDPHDIITYGPTVPMSIKDINWILSAGRRGPPRRPSFQVNNLFAVFKAVDAGMGLAVLPDYIIGKESDLVRVLTDVDVPQFKTYFVYPRELRGSKRVGEFRDYLVNQVTRAADLF